VEVPRLPLSRLEPVIGAPRYAELTRTADQVRQVLAGRTIWNVNSTAAGGGVAEMLQILVGYVQDLHIPIGWLVITGDAAQVYVRELPRGVHLLRYGRLLGTLIG
jgi:trehalose synthase